MRKYLLFTFVFLVSLVYFYQASNVDAAVKGQACGREIGFDGSLIADHGNCDNDPRFVCDKANPGDNLDPSQKCYEKKDVTCTCNPGQAAQTGKNGFSCPGGPSGFCNDSKQLCEAGNSDASSVRDAKDAANSMMYAFKGIQCVEDRRVAPGEECSGKQCQSPGPDGKIYECKPRNGALVDGTYGFEGHFCQEVGNAAGCPKRGEKCSLIAAPETGGCCQLDADNVTRLACSSATDTCEPQEQIQCTPEQKNSNTCNECAKENEECGFQADGRTANVSENCCGAKRDNLTLSCVNASNNIIDMSKEKGSCKFIDTAKPLPGTVEPTPTIPLPPPPPCNGPLVNGTCPSFMTAVGEVATDPGGFLQRVFAILLAVSGGIALLLIMKAGYQLMVSAGNPEKVKAGREQLTAAIVGLLFIVFSFVILEVINVDILGIPGFG